MLPINQSNKGNGFYAGATKELITAKLLIRSCLNFSKKSLAAPFRVFSFNEKQNLLNTWLYWIFIVATLQLSGKK